MVNSTLLSQDSDIETFNVTVYANKTLATSQSFSVEPGESTTANLIWSTEPFAKGNFTIEVTVSVIPCEIDIADNSFTAGWLMIPIPGDFDGDKDVDLFDITFMTIRYGVVKPDPLYSPICDFDDDGDIDTFDVTPAASNYGESW